MAASGRASASKPFRVIEPASGWRSIDYRELWEYRDVLYFLVRRDIRVRYTQSVFGIGWAVIQPVFFMIVFSIVFGRLAGVRSDGVPYPIFSFAALVPWTYFSTAFTESTNSLVLNQGMIKKVYFPRLTLPLAPVISKLVDFGVAFVVLLLMMAWYRSTPTVWVLTLPFLLLLTAMLAWGIGTWLTSMAVQYRDVKYGITFAAQLLMYCSPVVYPATWIPDRYRLIYGLNPMAGVVEGFRSALLGTTPMPWDLLAVGTVVTVLVTLTGTLYFRRTEHIFDDVA